MHLVSSCAHFEHVKKTQVGVLSYAYQIVNRRDLETSVISAAKHKQLTEKVLATLQLCNYFVMFLFCISDGSEQFASMKDGAETAVNPSFPLGRKSHHYWLWLDDTGWSSVLVRPEPGRLGSPGRTGRTGGPGSPRNPGSPGSLG